MIKLLLFATALIISSGCSTGGEFLSEREDGWFNHKDFFTSQLVYCRANKGKKEDDTAYPICYEAERTTLGLRKR